MYLVGIDPGHTGAVAVLDAHGTLEALADTPTLTLKVQRGRARRMMCRGWLRSYDPMQASSAMCASRHRPLCRDRVPARCSPRATAWGYG